MARSAFPGFPQFDTQLVNDKGELQVPWDHFFITLWQKVGSANSLESAEYLFFDGATLFAINVQTGAVIPIASGGDIAFIQAEIDVLNAEMLIVQSQIAVLQAQVGVLQGQVAVLQAADVENTTLSWALRRGQPSSNANYASEIANAYAFRR